MKGVIKVYLNTFGIEKSHSIVNKNKIVQTRFHQKFQQIVRYIPHSLIENYDTLSQHNRP